MLGERFSLNVNFPNRFLCLGLAIVCTSCTSMKVSEFEGVRPILDPAAFFTGYASSSGVMENRGGAPMKRVTTTTFGHWEGATLHLEQDIVLGDAKPQHRSWRIRKLDTHHFVATANDMLGTASGEAYVNIFHWSFTLALSPGNPLANVQMNQWMYLQPDGRTLVNHSTIRKFGLVVAQVSEQFRRGAEAR